jgi:hypothetical protein
MGQYADYINTKNPYLFWELQETSGTNPVDSSGNGNDGTHVLNSGNISLNNEGFVDDASVHISGNARIGIGPVDVAPFSAGGSGTFEIWFKLDTLVTNWGRIVLVGSDTISFQAMTLTSFSNTSNYNIGSPACDYNTGKAIEAGWQHLAVVKDNTVAKFYHNGVYNGQTSCVPTTPQQTIRIGGGLSSEHLNGYYSHFAVYDRVVPEAELLEHYQIGAGILSLNHVTGTVRVGGKPTRRAVHIHNRDTGELLGSGYSDPITGYYDIGTLSSDPCYVVVLEDPAVNKFESRVRDYVVPEPVVL